MRDIQSQIIAALEVRPTIDPADEVRKRVDFLKAYLRSTGAEGFVLGVSGGQDSSLAGRLAQLAIEELASEGLLAEFVAVRLPYGVQADEEDAQLALSFIQPKSSVVFDIKRAVDGFQSEYDDAAGHAMTDFTKGNVKARSRMVAQYALAGQARLLVIGTDQRGGGRHGVLHEVRRRRRGRPPAHGPQQAPGARAARAPGGAGAAVPQGPHGGPPRRHPRSDRRGQPRPHLRRHRRLPRGPRRRRRGGRGDRGEIREHGAQATRPREHVRRLVEVIAA